MRIPFKPQHWRLAATRCFSLLPRTKPGRVLRALQEARVLCTECAGVRCSGKPCRAFQNISFPLGVHMCCAPFPRSAERATGFFRRLPSQLAALDSKEPTSGTVRKQRRVQCASRYRCLGPAVRGVYSARHECTLLRRARARNVVLADRTAVNRRNRLCSCDQGTACVCRYKQSIRVYFCRSVAPLDQPKAVPKPRASDRKYSSLKNSVIYLLRLFVNALLAFYCNLWYVRPT